jgi:class 3 adenylate cyclase
VNDEAPSRRVPARVAHVVFFDQVDYSLLPLEEQAQSAEQMRAFVTESAPYIEADKAGQVIPIDSGDGMALVFLEDPQVAAECALAVGEFSRSRPGAPLRIGLNSGPITLREDVAGKRNVSGAGIDMAQRAMSVANPHEIMVTRSMADTLTSFEAWRPLLTEAGSFSVKHGQKLLLYRLGPEGERPKSTTASPAVQSSVGQAIGQIVNESLAMFTTIGRAGSPPAVPMLEQFLSEAKAPEGDVSPVWMDVPLALLVAVLIECIPMHGFAFIPAALSIWPVIQWRRRQRSRQIERLSPQMQAAWERWDSVRRLVHIQKNHALAKHVPAPVLVALETAAREWHEIRGDLRSVAVSDPLFTKEIQDEVDAVMMSAAAVAAPVVRRDDQSRRLLWSMEADTALMGKICQRIDREAAKLRQWAADASAAAGAPEETLRDRLALSRQERAAAEAELRADIGSDAFRH